MSLILSGSDGLSDVDGSAATPAIRGTDANTGIFFGTDIIGFSEGGVEAARINADSQFVAAAGTAALPVITTTGDLNTGIFFPAADTIAFSEGGVESMRLDSSGDVNLYNAKSFKTYNSANTRFGSLFTDGNGTNLTSHNGSGEPILLNSPTGYIALSTNGSERARIDSSGNLLVGTTGLPNGTSIYGTALSPQSNNRTIIYQASSNTGSNILQAFYNPNGNTGAISTNGSATVYATSSDYRLKENIAPMTGALTRVAALKPVTYKWKVDGENGEGFIAHELAEVVPQCVTGEKDAVDENGKPAYQGIDTSFLVATLTAAIQKQQALITQLQTDVAALKAR
jgi:hypothetical protein